MVKISLFIIKKLRLDLNMNLPIVFLIKIFQLTLVSGVLDSFEIQFIFYPAENSTEKFILKTNQLLQE